MSKSLSNLKSLTDLVNIAKNDEEMKAQKIFKLPIEDVVSKIQVRKKFHDIEGLAATIKSDGQQNAITVYPKNHEGKYIIQTGERRWRAIKLLGNKTIDVVVKNETLSTVDSVAVEMIENVQRDDLKPLEIAGGIKILMEGGLSHEDIAKRIGKTKYYISIHSSLINASEKIIDIAEKGFTKDARTLNELVKLEKSNPDIFNNLYNKCLEEGNGISRADVLNSIKKTTNSDSDAGSEIVGGDLPKKEESSTETKVDNAYKEDGELNLDSGSNTEFLNDPDEDDLDEDDLDEDEENTLEQSQHTKKPEKWVKVESKNLIIHCVVITDTDRLPAIIHLDRISSNPEEMWVRIVRSGKDMKVNVNDIELIATEIMPEV